MRASQMLLQVSFDCSTEFYESEARRYRKQTQVTFKGDRAQADAFHVYQVRAGIVSVETITLRIKCIGERSHLFTNSIYCATHRIVATFPVISVSAMLIHVKPATHI